MTTLAPPAPPAPGPALVDELIADGALALLTDQLADARHYARQLAEHLDHSLPDRHAYARALIRYRAETLEMR